MTRTNPSPGAAASEPPRKRQKLSPPPASVNTTSPSTVSTTNQGTNNVGNMEDLKLQPVVSDNGFQPDRESQVGILHFVNTTNPGFSGVLKHRYTDFLVNEIALDGTVVHLTDDRAPNFKATSRENEIPAPKVKPEEKTQGGPKGHEAEAEPVNGTAATILPPRTQRSGIKTELENDVSEANAKPSIITEPANNVPDLIPEDNTAANFTAHQPQEDAKPSFHISPEDDELLAKYFGVTLKDEVVQFHEKILSKPGAKPAVLGSLLTELITDRALRGRIHQDVRRIFESRIETESIQDGKIKITAASKAVAAQHGKNGPPIAANQLQRGRNQPGQAKGKLGWDELGGEYLHFSLYKENKDTMEVLGYLAKTLRVKPKDFSFAGTKDRRAATVQRVSIFRQHAKNLARVNSSFKPGSRIGDFKHEKHKLELGELAGNLFQITLRDCHFGDDAAMDDGARIQFANEVVGQAVKHIQEHGFINYFGLQRFGTYGIGTDIVGKLILKEDFGGAVKAILTYNDSLADGSEPTDRIGRDDIARAQAIKLFEKTGKGQQALETLPRKFTAEAAIIRQLSSHNRSSDYCGALLMINRGLRTMYVHAYQSLVWNMVASERWARYGNKVVKGDLVLIDNQSTNGKEAKDEVDENGEIVVHPAADDVAVHHDDIYERARSLSEEEAESGQYSIFDIVLPTPGFDIEYPGNDIGDFYKEFMGSERGGGLDPANMRRKQKDFSLSGSYRKFIAQVGKDLSFKIKPYHQETEQLVETDLEKVMKGRPQAQNDYQNQSQLHENGLRGKENDRYNGGRGGRGGRGNHGRGTGFNSGRGGQKNNYYGRQDEGSHTSDPSSSQYQDIRLTENSTQLNAWQALPAKLEAEDKAAAVAAEHKKLTEPPIDPDSISQPEYKETYIKTSVDDNGRHTVRRSTKIVGTDGVLRDLPKENPTTIETPASTTAVESTVMEVDSGQIASSSTVPSEPIKAEEDAVTVTGTTTEAEVDSAPSASITTAAIGHIKSGDKTNPVSTSFVSTDDQDGGVKLSQEQSPAKRSSQQISTDSTAEAETEPATKAVKTKEASADAILTAENSPATEAGPVKIAVILKFALSSSQYATMALRELMKAGGVKTYKPDFSSGR